MYYQIIIFLFLKFNTLLFSKRRNIINKASVCHMSSTGHSIQSPKLQIQTQQVLLTYFFLSREQKRKFDWSQKNVCLYRSLLSLFYDDIDLQQIVIPHEDLNQKFNKFFSTSFKMKKINATHEDVYNLNQYVLFTLDQKVNICQASKRNPKIQPENKKQSSGKFTLLNIKYQIQAWKKIQYPHTLIKISVSSGESRIMFVDKSLFLRFRIEILNEDFNIKSNFINNFLFCNQSPNFSTAFIAVQKLKKGHVLKDFSEKVYVIFEGQAIQQISKKNTSKSMQIQSQKWKIQLVRGSIICRNYIKNQLKIAENNYVNENIYIYSYYLLTDCIFLTIPYHQFAKILKTDKKTKQQLYQKLNILQKSHQQILQRSLNAQKLLKSSESAPIQLYYSIPNQSNVKKNSKAFRKKTQADKTDNNCEEFISFDRYEKMTQNKQNIEKKHLIYAHLNYLIREKQKQQRFIKKMNTEKGMKQIKKCQYKARLKQAKIQSLALKDSILNAQKFRDRPHQVKFIFEQQILDKYLKSRKTIRRNKNNFVSMIQINQNNNTETQALFKTQYKWQPKDQDNQGDCKNKIRPFSRFVNRSAKLLNSQSSSNIIEINGKKKNNLVRSTLNIEKDQFY